MTDVISISKGGALCPQFDPRRQQRRKRKRELLNTLAEALTIFGLASCFLLCVLLMNCLC